MFESVLEKNRFFYYCIAFPCVMFIGTGFCMDLKMWSGISDNVGFQTLQESGLKNDGKVVFINHKTNDTLAVISAEIADNDMKRERGLMWRYHLSDTSAMVFVYDNEKERVFWMKNTYIALDIIFVNAKNKIVTVLDHTIPLSETSLSSGKPVTCVIEVNTGFCHRYNLHTGDRAYVKRY